MDGDEKEEVPVDSKSERSKQGYYRCMTNDADLFEAMEEKYSKYISKTYLEHCIHSFNTQMNEGMNNSVAKYAPKGKHYGATKSLLTRVFIAAGVQLVGHHFFWEACYALLEVKPSIQLECHLLKIDRHRVIQFHRDHNYENMAKRKRLEHEKLRLELQKQRDDFERNATYESQTGCADDSLPTTVATNMCIHRVMGCSGAKGHKTNRSQHCRYSGLKSDELAAALTEWNGNPGNVGGSDSVSIATPKITQTGTNHCIHSNMGCGGAKGHKTNRSTHCRYVGLNTLQLEAARGEWETSHGEEGDLAEMATSISRITGT